MQVIEVTAGALLTAVALGSADRRACRRVAPFAIGPAYAVLLTALAPIDNGGWIGRGLPLRLPGIRT